MGRLKAPWAFRKGRKNERHGGYRGRWYYQVIQGDMYVIHEGEYLLLMHLRREFLSLPLLLLTSYQDTGRVINPTRLFPILRTKVFTCCRQKNVTGLFRSNENTIGPAMDLLALVLREASRDRR